jgi:hypothetical protein
MWASLRRALNRLMTRLLHVAALAAVMVGLCVPASDVAGQVRTDRTDLTQQLTGVVLDFATGAPLEDVSLRVQGTDQVVQSNDQGEFILRDAPAGTWTLEVSAEGYGARTYAIELEPGGFAEVEISLAAEEPTPVQPSADPVDPVRMLGTVVDAERIAGVVGTVRNLGELIRQTLPTLRVREASGFAGVGLCLEFRSSSSGGRGLVVEGNTEEWQCFHPQVFLDGIRSTDPEFIYSLTALDDIRRIQAIPTAEAGARFGAAPYGVILVETRFVADRPSPVDIGVGGASGGIPAGGPYVSRSPRGFDWTQDPEGHSFFKALIGATVGNALGLAAGIAVGRQCVFVEDLTEEIAFSCGNGGVAAASVAAITIPAFGSALGARVGGSTDTSVGKLVPAMIGAGMGILPGYIFSLSTVGDGVQTMNTVGQVFLVVGSPIFATIADKVYRSLW